MPIVARYKTARHTKAWYAVGGYVLTPYIVRAISLVLAMACVSTGSIFPLTSSAEILNRNSPLLRIRVGSGGGVNTVIYNPLAPSYLVGLGAPAGQTEAVSISTTNIPGGSGVFEVRFVLDVNAKFAAPPPLTGTFTYDSSAGMQCTTPSTCGAVIIPMDKIAWAARDNDTINTVFQYDGSASQVFQVQTDTNIANNRLNTRHRNWYQYRYINDQLFPAGTYEGTVIINGVGN